MFLDFTAFHAYFNALARALGWQGAAQPKSGVLAISPIHL